MKALRVEVEMKKKLLKKLMKIKFYCVILKKAKNNEF